MNTFKYIKQLWQESIVYGFWGVASRFLNFFLIPIYTRVFSPDDYGIISLIDSLVVFLSLFTILGLDESSARWFYDTEEEPKRKIAISSWFWCQIIFSAILIILILSFSSPLSKLLFNSSKHKNILSLAIAAIPFMTFPKISGNLLRYLRKPATTSIYNILTTLLKVLLIILFVVFWKWGITGIYYGTLWALIIAGILSAFILKDWISPKYFDLQVSKDMLVYGFPLIPAAIASWITISSDRFIIQIFHDSYEVGVYAVGVVIASGYGLIISAFQLAYGPFAMSIYKNEDAPKIYNKVLLLYSWVGCTILVSLSLFIKPILTILATKEYLPGASCFPFLAFSFFFIGLRTIASVGPSIAKKSLPVAKSIFLAALTNILFNFILIPRFGKEGAAFSSMLAYLISTIYLFFVSQKINYFPFNFKPVIYCIIYSWFVLIINSTVHLSGITQFIIRAFFIISYIPLLVVFDIIKIATVRKYLYKMKI